MMPDKEALARKHFREGLRVVGDEAVADRIYDEEKKKEKTARRKMRDAPVPRPQLKFEVRREGSALKLRHYIFAMIADMNARRIPDPVQVATILKKLRGEVDKTSLSELINGSSECDSPRNRKRLSG
jgi:hypothetical protein